MNFSNNLCIVPARGGSKRVRGKNIRNFAGKPMISHTLDTLRRSELFERIIVSTDSAEISEVAEKYGAEVPFERPARLSDDTATIADVMAHATHFLKDSGELGDVESVSCVFATNPFLQKRDLKKRHR